MRVNFRLDGETRADARAALQILEGSGLSLSDAARLAVGRAQGVSKTSLQRGIDLFLKECLRKNLRARTVEFYEFNLQNFADASPDASLDDFSRAELKAWIVAQGEGKRSDATPMAYLRAIRALFRWARRQDPPLCLVDPTEGLRLDRVLGDRAVSVFRPEDVAAVMGASGEYTAAAALLFFAGLRPSEIYARDKGPLTWDCIDFGAKVVRVPAELAKTRTARALEELPPNLWRWLRKFKGAGAIAPGQMQFYPRRVTYLIADGWKQDGPRHSFATYHVALYESTERTSLLLGHEGRTALLHQRYRGLATKAAAKEYFAIVP